MRNISLVKVLLVITTVFIVNYSCLNRNRKPDVKPELSLKNKCDTKMLVIDGKIAGNWFYIFENPKNIELDEYYLRGTFEWEVVTDLQMLIKPKELPEFRTGESELEIVDNKKDADLESKIFLEKNNKYGIYLFYPAGAHKYPIFYFVYDGKTVKLVD